MRQIVTKPQSTSLNGELKPESFLYPFGHIGHFEGMQFAEFSFKFDDRDGLDLLKLKRALLQKRFLDGKLPPGSAQGCSMGENTHESEVRVSRPVSEQEAWPYFSSQSQVNDPHFTSAWSRHSEPPIGPILETPHQQPRLPIPTPLFRLPIQTPASRWRAVLPALAWEVVREYRSHSLSPERNSGLVKRQSITFNR